MSYTSYTKYGFGFDQLYNKNNFHQIRNFVTDSLKENNHLALAEKIEKVINPKDIEEILNEDASWYIASEINKRENITLCEGFQASSVNPEAIGIVPLFPWQLREKDSEISFEKATEILKKYGKILGIKEEPDYFVQQYNE